MINFVFRMLEHLEASFVDVTLTLDVVPSFEYTTYYHCPWVARKNAPSTIDVHCLLFCNPNIVLQK